MQLSKFTLVMSRYIRLYVPISIPKFGFYFYRRNNQELSFNTRYMYNSFYCFLFSSRYTLWFVSFFVLIHVVFKFQGVVAILDGIRKKVTWNFVFYCFILLAFSTKFWEIEGLRNRPMRNYMYVKPSNIAAMASPKAKECRLCRPNLSYTTQLGCWGDVT